MQALPAAVSLSYASRAGRAGGMRPERARCFAAPRRRAPLPARCAASGGDDVSSAGGGDEGGEAGRGDAPGEPPVGGNAALQDELVDVLRFETAKRSIADQVSDFVAGEQENLRALVEQGKEELDALEQLSRDRSTLEFGAAMADINAMADEFTAGLRADREAALRAQDELADFEAQASRDMNAYLPYQNLYQPTVTRQKRKPRKPLSAAAEASANAEAAAVAAAARTAVGPALRGGAYAAVAGTILALLAAAATGPGLSAGQMAIGTLALSALGFQVWLQANGALGSDDDAPRDDPDRRD